MKGQNWDNYSPLPARAFLVAFLLALIQLAVMVAGTCISLSRFRSIGKYNRRVKWPLTYKLKLVIQVLNLLISFASLVLSIVQANKYAFRYLQLVEQLCVWSLSLAMFRFEYKRALKHAWFMLPALWVTSSLYYGAEFYIQYSQS